MSELQDTDGESEIVWNHDKNGIFDEENSSEYREEENSASTKHGKES